MPVPCRSLVRSSSGLLQENQQVYLSLPQGKGSRTSFFVQRRKLCFTLPEHGVIQAPEVLPEGEVRLPLGVAGCVLVQQGQ